MAKRLFHALIAFLFAGSTLLSLTPPEAFGGAAPLSLTASSAFMMDGVRGNVLYSKKENLKRQPASTVKVMTALVVIEHLPVDRVITVPDNVEAIEPSKIYLKTGEKFTVLSLLKALLLSSANDAAYTLAIATAGSQAKFSDMMNERARRLGANSSHFVSPHGLPDERQYTTSKDLTLIMREAEHDELLINIMHQKTAVIYSADGRKVILRNHNKLLWRDPRDIIGKTGWTRKARHCFVGRAAYGKKILLFAIMGSVRPWNDLGILINAFTGGLQQLKQKQYHELRWSVKERKKIQKALQKSGSYKGPIDGKFGPETQKAIAAFQKGHHLKSDGIIGTKTLEALQKYL